MAYTDKQIEEIVIFDTVVENDLYRSDNARKVNSNKKPNGYIYVLQNKRFDLIKVGVSSSPKRRIRDIKAGVPFDIDCLFLKHFNNVYDLESIIHKQLINNKVKGEWFQVYKDDVVTLINVLKEVE
jgi:hypothetical protein